MECCCDRCKNELCASKISIFQNLSRKDLIEIIKMTGHKTYNRGEIIFQEGNEADTLYLINEGKIKLFNYTKNGKEQILHILSDGDFFGELNLLKKGEYSFYAEAITSTKVCTLKKEKMSNLIIERPEIGLNILEVVVERLSKVETLVKNMSTNEVEVRIAYLLLELINKYGSRTINGLEIESPITREEMSNYTGLARETISRKLKKFEKEGIIKLVGLKKIIIINEEKLQDYI